MRVNKIGLMAVISFVSLPMERVWGGRALETAYGRTLPKEDGVYGEAWELVDRPQEQSVVAQGGYAGKTLHELWTEQRELLFGEGLPDSERFPLLVKILDARDDLSIQVHPPAHLAESLAGEPKTEMWYVAEAAADAQLYVGLRAGVDRGSFEEAIEQGTVAEQVHAIAVRGGDSIFIPSGRLHAIGAGLLIFEIQQNSDTTYRVFDWNRLGLDGKARELHVAASLASIDFSDIEPQMDVPQGNVLALCEFFLVEKFVLAPRTTVGNAHSERFALLTIVEGALEDASGQRWERGATVLLTRGNEHLSAVLPSVVLRTSIPC